VHDVVVLDRKKVAQEITSISRKYGLEVNPNLLVKTLPVGVQQRVEIIKLLYRNADILILDEPTAVLTPQEADDLFVVLRNFKAQGKSIIFITHKLREVLELADRITVLRLGRVVGSADPKQATNEELARMMVGREVILTVDKQTAKPGATVLRVDNLQVTDERQNQAVQEVCLEVRAGEVLGVAGVQGNGQTELVKALTGLLPAVSGSVNLLGTDITHSTPREVYELGVAHVPEDRQADGLVLSYPIEDNMILSEYYRKPFANGIMLNRPAIEQAAQKRVKEYDVRTPSIYAAASTLSGGNQQKVIVAREFSRPIKLLIASQPTRGLDVGSIEYIHNRIIEKRDEGTAVLLVSNELDEILSLSDRIAVMYKGRIIATVDAETANKEQLGLLMAGVTGQEVKLAPTPANATERAELNQEIA
jgi:ABC-type uncharacterized transport system ATPase subunit